MRTEEGLKAFIDSMPPVKRAGSQRTVPVEELIEALRKSFKERYDSLPPAEKREWDKKERLYKRRREKAAWGPWLSAVSEFEKFLIERLIEKCVACEYSVYGTPINIISLKTNLSPYKIKIIVEKLGLKPPPAPYPSKCSYRFIRSWTKKYPKHGTSMAEKRLLNLLRKHFPRQWRYVGDWKVVIGNKCPDFINKGQKLIIELFGDWHHLGLLKRRRPDLTKKRAEEERIKHFDEYGYRTLIIWASELRNEKKVARKIKSFMEGSHVARTAD